MLVWFHLCINLTAQLRSGASDLLPGESRLPENNGRMGGTFVALPARAYRELPGFLPPAQLADMKRAQRMGSQATLITGRPHQHHLSFVVVFRFVVVAGSENDFGLGQTPAKRGVNDWAIYDNAGGGYS
jgi:hypothetical protein